MASAQSLKRRIKSVTSIGTITKAMELVAATKMRRSQEFALASRPYAYTALKLLGILAGLQGVEFPELLRPREIKKTAYVLVTSDKGLAGSFNSAVIKKFENFVKEKNIDITDGRNSFIAVGQKAKSYLERKKANVIVSFLRVGDFTTVGETNSIAEAIIAGYVKHDFDGAIIFFSTFVTALRQDAVAREFLPVTYDAVKQSIEDTVPRAGKYSDYARSESFLKGREREYIIEPSPKEVLDELAPRLLKTRVYHAILEANASEHSARRVAMKNASDNANELSLALNLEYNKSRQAAITNAIIEVTSGSQSSG
jgi:F-type H+-transporting ATPase subunit gamma